MTIFNSNMKSVVLKNCPRRTLHIHWSDRIRNNVTITGSEIGRRWCQWIGQTLEEPVSNTTRHILTWNPQGKKKRGRPKDTLRSPGRHQEDNWHHIRYLLSDASELQSCPKIVKNPLMSHKVEHYDMFYHSHKHTQWSLVFIKSRICHSS